MGKTTARLLLLSLSLAMSACAPMMIAAGADMAASGLGDATTAVANGGSVGGCAVAATAAGVALMSAGTVLTPPAQRQPLPPPPPARTAAPPIYWPLMPANAPNAPKPHMGMRPMF